MAAKKVRADDAGTWQRLEKIGQEAQQQSYQSHPTPGLTFVLPSKGHPHPGQLWDQRVMPVFGGESGWLDPGDWISTVALQVPNTDEARLFQVFASGLCDDGRERLKAIANEVFKWLQRLGYSVCPEQLFVELFERCEGSGRLRWERNEQPNHPGAASVVARLDDVFGEIAALVAGFCDNHNATPNARRKKRAAHRPPDTDEKADAKIADAWLRGRNSGEFLKYADLATEHKLDESVIREAIDRDRKRRPDVWRQKQKPRRKKSVKSV